MKIAVMQPYLFPYIGYFQLMAIVDKFIVLDDVNYMKKGWINRNRIVVAGKEHLFTLPLEHASQNRHVNQINLADNKDWSDTFIQTIERSYRKAPFFQQTFNIVSHALDYAEKNLSGFILNSLRLVMLYAGIHTRIVESSSVYGNANLRGQDRVIDICIQEKAAEYVNLPGGVELYNAGAFATNGISLSFLSPILDTYSQFTETFLPAMSIIDVLMFNSPETTRRMMLAEKLK